MAKMNNLAVLGRAMEEVETVLKKMGGTIESDMTISQIDYMSDSGVIWVKAEMYFDSKKLNEYVAQPHPQATGNA